MPRNKVAIIGASGFVGGALCERLFFERRNDFLPFIRGTANAARIARLGIPIQQLDLMNADAVAAALKDCSTVINCSRGDHTTMIRGLSNLIKGVKCAGVERLVHVSSMAIYGDDPGEGSRSDSYPATPGDNEYGRMKARQDEMVFGLARQGVLSYIICPSNITGPYSPYTLGLVNRLLQGPLPIVDDGNNPCNLVHVDNLVEAILSAAQAETGSGERYFANETQPTTWKQMYEDLASRLGFVCSFTPTSREDVIRANRIKKEPSGLIAHLKIALSGEFREAIAMMPAFRRMNELASEGFTRMPLTLQQRIRSRFERPLSITKRRNGPPLDDPFVRVQIRRIYHSPEKLKRVCGYRPVLSYEQGLKSTTEWLAFVGAARPMRATVVK